jgi:hypothetical protein
MRSADRLFGIFPTRANEPETPTRITWSGRKSKVLITKAQVRQERIERTLDTLTRLSRIRKAKGRTQGMPEDYAIALAKFPDRVAAIVGKTFVVRGSDAFDETKLAKGEVLSDDEALAKLKDLLDELNPTLIERNKKKSLKSLHMIGRLLDH